MCSVMMWLANAIPRYKGGEVIRGDSPKALWVTGDNQRSQLSYIVWIEQHH